MIRRGKDPKKMTIVRDSIKDSKEKEVFFLKIEIKGRDFLKFEYLRTEEDSRHFSPGFITGGFLLHLLEQVD